jgi:uncharacterized membrane protein
MKPSVNAGKSNATAEYKRLPLLARLSAGMRLAAAIAAGLIAALAMHLWIDEPHIRVLAAWDVAVTVYLADAWVIIFCLDARETRARVQRQDQSAFVVFLIVFSAAWASLLAIVWGLHQTEHLESQARLLPLGLAVIALAGSWLLIQTVFAFHYARAYYRPAPSSDDHARGLRFPGSTDPDYMDFLYYACVIGMTSQVADVAVTSRHMRRLTLVHGVASFGFNLVILALAVNLVAGAFGSGGSGVSKPRASTAIDAASMSMASGGK